MSGLFAFLFSISFIALVVGIVKPSLFSKFFQATRKTTALALGGLTLLFFILTGATAPKAVVKGTSDVNVMSPTATVFIASPTATPTLTSTPSLTPTPTKTTYKAAPTPTHYVRPTQAASQSPTNSTGGSYINVDGNKIQSPVESDQAPAGATAQCGDGSYSFSAHRSGTCSHHGGVSRWL